MKSASLITTAHGDRDAVACSLTLARPRPASLAGGAGARPDRPISGRQMFFALSRFFFFCASGT